MKYRLLIILATLIWGSSFTIVKDTTGSVSPSWILFVRFAVAGIILALVFVKRRNLYFTREHIACGALFGLLLFCAYYFQTMGITDTTPGKNAFLTGTYCVVVPFIAWLLVRKRPTRFNLIAACLCVLGIGLVSLDGGLAMSFGDMLTLVAAVFYALHIVVVSKFSQDKDIYVLTMWQFLFAALLAFAFGLVFEPTPNFGVLAAQTWLSLFYLAIFCTAVALLFQNVAQQKLPPATASLLLSLESPFGVAFSVALGYEVLNVRIVSGFIVIFVAILVSEVLPVLRQRHYELQ